MVCKQHIDRILIVSTFIEKTNNTYFGKPILPQVITYNLSSANSNVRCTLTASCTDLSPARYKIIMKKLIT